MAGYHHQWLSMGCIATNHPQKPMHGRFLTGLTTMYTVLSWLHTWYGSSLDTPKHPQSLGYFWRLWSLVMVCSEVSSCRWCFDVEPRKQYQDTQLLPHSQMFRVAPAQTHIFSEVWSRKKTAEQLMDGLWISRWSLTVWGAYHRGYTWISSDFRWFVYGNDGKEQDRRRRGTHLKKHLAGIPAIYIMIWIW